jgi:hypothetical protein
MIKERLQETTAVIRKGDKETGKELLLDILNHDPENDTGWVWMSAVVDTDELRLECLQEALKYNPDNQMAQKGVAKLRENGVGETSSFSSTVPSESPPNVSSQAMATVEYLCKRLIIEKWYQVLVAQLPSGQYEENPFLNPEHFLFPIPAGDFSELTPLMPYFDMVLFRQTGGSFTIICLKMRNNRNSDETSITQEELIKIGRDCLPYSPVVAYGQQFPVGIEIWELFEREITPDDMARLQALKRLPGRKKVSVTPIAIDLVDRKVKRAYMPGITAVFRPTHVSLINRWLKEELAFSEEKTLTALASGGVKIGPILLGAFAGIILALTIEFLLLMLEWQRGWIVDAIGAFTAISIAIFSRTVRVDNQKQGIITAFIFAIGYYALMLLFLGYWLGLFWIWNIFWLVGLGALLGRVTEP